LICSLIKPVTFFFFGAMTGGVPFWARVRSR